MNPTKLQVVMVNTYRTRLAIVHENAHLPYRHRLVTIELTPEQIQQLRPRKLGVECGNDQFEELGAVWLEPAD